MPASSKPIDQLLDIMQRLRDPKNGCPWDIEQDFSSIVPYTIEEAYEVADVVAREAWDELPDELGDLLLQVVFHAQMAAEKDWFKFDDVVKAINDKMVRRHPHVFAEAKTMTMTSIEQTNHWEQLKQQERRHKGYQSILDDVPTGLPELARAIKLQKRAARIGFDWTGADAVLVKLDEELKELAEARSLKDRSAIEDELGDVLLVLTNLARKLEIDPAQALRGANQKFERRFRQMEQTAEVSGKPLKGRTLEQLEALWVQAKLTETK